LKEEEIIMTREEIVTIINSVFEESFEIQPERLVPEANIFLDLGLDSLDTVDLVVAIQKKFGVQIRDDERVRSIRTLGDVYQFIEVIYNEKKA
jgi:acyl carrier protein